MELLYIESSDLRAGHEGDGKNHYVYIKDFNRLMFGFTKHKGSKHFCMHCLKLLFKRKFSKTPN